MQPQAARAREAPGARVLTCATAHVKTIVLVCCGVAGSFDLCYILRSCAMLTMIRQASASY